MVISALIGFLLQAAAPTPGPEHFFVGRTEGVGTVRIMLRRGHAVRDHNRGRLDAHGALLLEQVIEEDGEPVRRRSWRLVRATGNRFTGTISDAVGPVTGEATGNVLHLRYRSAEGPTVEQWITIQPGGRTAHNRMTFRRYGMNVATVEGIVRRVD